MGTLEKVGKYELVERLGEGGMGEVYRAFNPDTRQHVALKRLHAHLAARADLAERFVREAQAAAALRHPNVINVLDAERGGEGRDAYLVLELLDGEPLSKRIERHGRLDWLELEPLILPILDALALAHAHGMVHRDIKPDNVFLANTPQGQLVPKLLDFGIAKLLGAKMTATAQSLGTPYYMSPEQFDDAGKVDARSDIWSMGVLLYEALTGALPFRGDSIPALITAIMSGRRHPIGALVPSVPAHVQCAVETALSLDPAGRYASMNAFADALRGLPSAARELAAVPAHDDARQAPVAPGAFELARTTPAGELTTRKRSKRSALLGLGAVLMLGALAIATWSLRRSSNHLPLSQQTRAHAKPEPRSPAAGTDASEPTAALPSTSVPDGMLRVEGARAELGSTLEEQARARAACAADVGARNCPAALFARERARSVTLPPFLLDEREVTAGAFAAWLSTLADVRIATSAEGRTVLQRSDGSNLSVIFDASLAPYASLEGSPGSFRAHGSPSRPATHVSYGAARAFCEAQGKRLPSAAEWELAARGSSRRMYPWGDTPPSCDGVRYARNAGASCASAQPGPASVGSSALDRTPEGLSDLGGNVGEWTSELFEPESAVDRRMCRENAPCRVFKGGDFGAPADRARAAAVNRAPESSLLEHAGFRCAKDVAP